MLSQHTNNPCILIATFLVYLPKRMIGERFNNLGMLTTLLASSKKVDVTSIGDSPKIEVIPDATGNSNDGDVFEVQETKFDWTEKGTCTYEVWNSPFMNSATSVLLNYLLLTNRLFQVTLIFAV